MRHYLSNKVSPLKRKLPGQCTGTKCLLIAEPLEQEHQYQLLCKKHSSGFTVSYWQQNFRRKYQL